jgi:oligopeptide/dipeptide ABC transporter ATP-binding protein
MSVSVAPVIEVENLRVTFRVPGRPPMIAVDGVSLVIGPGESVGIVGESGSGKSTFARALLGLLPDGTASIEAEQMRANGVPVLMNDLARLRGRTAAMVFQDPLSYLNPLMTVGKQIAESVRRHDREAQLVPRIEELLDLVRLPKTTRHSYPHELSGGMRQRVLLAIALGCRPQLLIADEPTTALDVTTQEEILVLIRDVLHKLNMSLLLISHDLGVVASLCQRMQIMYRGRVVEWGSAARIFSTPRHPYTRGLLDAARALQDLNGRFITMETNDAALSAHAVEQGCPFVQRCDSSFNRCSEEIPPALSGQPRSKKEASNRAKPPQSSTISGTRILSVCWPQRIGRYSAAGCFHSA